MKRRKRVFAWIVFVAGITFFVISCKGEQQELAHETRQHKENMLFNVRPVQLPDFNRNASEVLSSWPVFQDFQREISDINGKTLVELRNKTQRLITYTDSLGRSIPASIKAQPVVSRVVVLNSRVRLLDQQVRKDRIDSAAIASDLTALMTSTARFYDQINQKLLKDAIDLQREKDEQAELEKQQRFLDSVQIEELKDLDNQSL